MFGTFLLASFAGAGAASVISSDLNARSNYPPSYLCNSANKKCSQPKQQASVTAYCSSYLKVPKTVTKTKTVTKCTTTTQTSFTSTQTIGTATPMTSTISLCATPKATPRPNIPNEKRDVLEERQNAQYYGGGGGYGGIAKPSCLSAYKNSKSISSACSCFSIKPKATTTTTVTKQKTETTVVKTDTTVTATSAETIFVRGTDLPFVVADYSVNYFQYGAQLKDDQNGINQYTFDTNDPGFDILLQLNKATQQLVVPNGSRNNAFAGSVAAQYTDPADAEARGLEGSRVFLAVPGNSDFSDFTPISCSISQDPVDLTCPLTCGVERGDVNQVGGVSSYRGGPVYTPWYLGQIGEKSDDPYVTYAVSRTVAEGGEPEEGGEGQEESGGN